MDATLAASFIRIISGEFEKKVQTMKMIALESGRRLTGREILFLEDQLLKLSDKDGAVYGLLTIA